MTPEIITVFAILGAAVVLFVSERIRVDLVALAVLGSLALTGLVTPAEALSGFSNVAVVTVWAVFVLSGGLSRTGVANLIGKQFLRLAGKNEARLIFVIMLTTSVLSGVMNDIGVAALFLPVVINIARTADIPPSKLLMPLAFAALLGGLNTLIGTPPNLLVSEALRDAGLTPFKLFDYTPVGITLTLTGILFMVFVGRRLLPSRPVTGGPAPEDDTDLEKMFDLPERLFLLQLNEDSPLAGKSLAESGIGALMDLNVLGFIRENKTRLSPPPTTILKPGDQLIVAGHLDLEQDDVEGDEPPFFIREGQYSVEQLVSEGIEIAELALSPGSPLLGRTLKEIGFRQQYGLIVLAIWRDNLPLRAELENLPLQAGDLLLVQGLREQLQKLKSESQFLISTSAQAGAYRLDERLSVLRIPADSSLVGLSLQESRLAQEHGATVLGITRAGETILMPSAQERFQVDDLIIVKCKPSILNSFTRLEDLHLEPQTLFETADLESDEVGLVEAIVSPHSTLAGKTLSELHFREKYGLNVLALKRGNRTRRADLGDIALRFGDSLLVHGPRQRINVLASETDFLVLAEGVQEAPRSSKAPIAVLIMAAVLTAVILDVLPIAIAAVIGVVLMVLTGCLTMDEAYRHIEWKAIFLIAGMLPLGIAMDRTGAAQFLAEEMVGLIGGYGPLAVLAGLYIMAALSSQVMPNPAVAVLLAPIALNTAANLGISPYPLMMAVALSASAAFLSPVGHSANVLIMAPGGYRFTDYLKVGVPLTLVTLIVALIAVPIFWPF